MTTSPYKPRRVQHETPVPNVGIGSKLASEP